MYAYSYDSAVLAIISHVFACGGGQSLFCALLRFPNHHLAVLLVAWSFWLWSVALFCWHASTAGTCSQSSVKVGSESFLLRPYWCVRFSVQNTP